MDQELDYEEVEKMDQELEYREIENLEYETPLSIFTTDAQQMVTWTTSILPAGE